MSDVVKRFMAGEPMFDPPASVTEPLVREYIQQLEALVKCFDYFRKTMSGEVMMGGCFTKEQYDLIKQIQNNPEA